MPSGSTTSACKRLRKCWRRALTPWEKPFVNCRTRRETELAEPFPIHVVCAWIGNSQPVAAKHYLQVTDDHFRQATEGAPKAAQKAAQYPSGRARMGREAQRETPVIPEEYGGLRYYTNVEAPRRGLEPRTQRLTAACSTN